MAMRSRNRKWHIERDGNELTLYRSKPVRFDLLVEADLPRMDRARLAHQIRQDMWRALQTIRGFRPAVQVTRTDAGVHVRAGGAIEARFPMGHAAQRLKSVLEDPENQARWQRFAGGRDG